MLATDAAYTNKAYLSFNMMLCDRFNRLLSPKFSNDEELTLLANLITELVCLHEGLYPICESIVPWHQLIDIAHHISKYGPLKGWWECSGERAMTTIKKHIPSGGTSFDKCLMKSYSKFENMKLKLSYSFLPDDIHRLQENDKSNDLNDIRNFSVKANNLLYSDEKIYLFNKVNQRKKKFEFSEYEIDCLLDEFIIEIKKRCHKESEAFYKSPLYRLYIAHLYHKNDCHKDNRWKFNTFYCSLLVFLSTDTGFYFRNAIKKGDDYYLEHKKLFKDLYENGKEYNKIKPYRGGTYFVEDLVVAKKILYNLTPFRFDKAIVFGIEMHCRGAICAETECTTTSTKNILNVLKQNWSDVKSISSWFKYHSNNKSSSEFGFDPKIFHYGQFNYFFRISLPEEPFIHGLPMASAICRKTKLNKYIQILDVSTISESFLNSKRFVCLTNVASSKILVGARDVSKKPIKLKKNYNLGLSESTNREKFFGSDISDLYFLDLHPHRDNIVFDELNLSYYKFEYIQQEY